MPFNRNRNIFLAAFFLIQLNAGPVICQQDTLEEYNVSKLRIAEISFDLAYPVKSFRDKMNTSAVGFGLQFLWQTHVDKPTFFGFQAYWQRYLTVADLYTDYVDNQLVDINRRTSVDLAGVDISLRIYPDLPVPWVEPYLEGFVGTKVNFTTTSLNLSDTGENIDFYFEDSNMSLSYGLAVGFQVNLYNYQYYLNFKTTYSSGTSAAFLALIDDTSGSPRPIDQLEEKNAPLEFVRFQLGLSFVF